LSIFLADREYLSRDAMLQYFSGTNWFECSVTNVELKFYDSNSAICDFVKNSLSEMQTCRWSRDGAALSRINGLISFAIVFVRGMRALNVRRQRRFANLVD